MEDAGASEKLIEAVMNPASIGPEVTPAAAAAVVVRDVGVSRKLYNPTLGIAFLEPTGDQY